MWRRGVDACRTPFDRHHAGSCHYGVRAAPPTQSLEIQGTKTSETILTRTFRSQGPSLLFLHRSMPWGFVRVACRSLHTFYRWSHSATLGRYVDRYQMLPTFVHTAHAAYKAPSPAKRLNKIASTGYQQLTGGVAKALCGPLAPEFFPGHHIP